MDKRAGFAQPIIDFYAVIVIVCIIMIFFLVLKLHSNSMEVTIKGDIDSVDGTLMLINYLKASFEHDSMKITVAEAIDLMDAGYDKDLQAAFSAKTKDFFKDYEEEAGCAVSLSVQYENTAVNFPTGLTASRCELSAVQRVPTLSGRQTIIRLEGKE